MSHDESEGEVTSLNVRLRATLALNLEPQSEPRQWDLKSIEIFHMLFDKDCRKRESYIVFLRVNVNKS